MDQLFYELDNEHYAYIPKTLSPQGKTLQSRNSFIGRFTEKWCQDLLSPIAKELGLYAERAVICEELALSRQSPADIALCKTKGVDQNAENIVMLFEVKMSIVSNFKYINNENICYIGDYKSHRGTPSLLRSDSMLKAIGKAINIRVSGKSAANIPIIVLGNSPIQASYTTKVDMLKQSGVLQGFWSLNPKPTDQDYVVKSDKLGFITINSRKEVFDLCKKLISTNMTYFSAMLPKQKIGSIISIASLEPTSELKAEKFLKLIGEQNDG